MEAIKQHFIDMPDLQGCWYNDEYKMIHYNHPAYPNYISREEALSDETVDTGNGRKKTAAELIENINAAETSEAAELAAEGDERKTVVSALEAKLKTFETK